MPESLNRQCHMGLFAPAPVTTVRYTTSRALAFSTASSNSVRSRVRSCLPHLCKAIEHDKGEVVYRYQAQQSRFGQMKCAARLTESSRNKNLVTELILPT